jgi:hypothetical protein
MSSGNSSPAISGPGNTVVYGIAEPPDKTDPAAAVKSSNDSLPPGSATSNGDFSPAVTGSANTVTYGKSEAPRKRNVSSK